MKGKMFVLLCWVVCSVVGRQSSALPILSVDLEPSVAGIQDTLGVLVGASFTADIVIEDVVELNAFELDLDFPANLSAVGVVSGGFLALPSITFESDVSPPDVNFAETNLFGSGMSGSGVLLSVTFKALAPGASPLALNDILLSAPFGISIGVGGANDATAFVTSGFPAPAPGTLLLFAVALLAAGGSRKRFSRGEKRLARLGREARGCVRSSERRP